jgi:cytochrome b561/polyisoprenoid-binding protein YceI
MAWSRRAFAPYSGARDRNQNMTDTAQQQRYTAVAIALHWTIAVLIIGMLAFGFILDSMTYGPGSPKTALVQIHKSIGITILLLSVARLIWRLMNRPPPEPPMPQWQKLLATTVHVLLYVLMIAMPLTGWIMASASTAHDTRFFGTLEVSLPGFGGMDVETRNSIDDSFHRVHFYLAWVIIGMLALHLAGAFKHQFIDKDGLLARMAPGLFGRTAGPPDNGHGALWAFGGAIALFAVIAGSSLLTSQSVTAPGPAVQSTTPLGVAGEQSVTTPGPETAGPAQASPAPIWIVDPKQSSIVFKSSYMDRPFEGRFEQWTANIQFDPAKPQDARIRVVIPTVSAKTAEPYFNDSLPEADWFDASKHKEAVFEVNEGVFKDSETQYEATGVLTVKGVKHPVRLPFTLNINGATAKMHAEITLKRLELGIGRGTPAKKASGNEEWVQDDVGVVIDVVATRQ